MQSFAHQLLAIQTPTLEPRPAAAAAAAAAPNQQQQHHEQQQQRSVAPLEGTRSFGVDGLASTRGAASDRQSGSLHQGNNSNSTSAHLNGRDRSSTQHIPCKFFRAGQCQAGDKCSFSHTTEPAAPLYCKYYARGHCKFGSKCALPHINDQERPTSAPAPSASLSNSTSNSNSAALSLSLTQLNSRNDTPSPSTSRSSFSYQQQQQHSSQQDDNHSFYDGATTPTPTTPVPVPASPNARSLAMAGLSSSASFSHRMSAPGGMVGSPGLASSFGPGSFDSMPSVPTNTPLDRHHLLDHYQQQQHLAHIQQQQQLAHSHGSAAGLLHARRERAMSLRRQSSMLGLDAASAHLSGSLPTGAGVSGWSLASPTSTTPTPLGHLTAAAQQRASLMSTSLYGTSPGAVGGSNVWQGGLASSPSYDPPAPHLSGSLPRASMMGGGGGGTNSGVPRSRLSASFLPGAAPASVPSRLSFSALGGSAGPYYGGESDDYSEPGYEVGMGSASYMGATSMGGHMGGGGVGNHAGSRLSSLSDDYDANSFHSGAADALDEDDTVSAGILPASLSDLLTPIEQRRFASQRTALPASSAPGGGLSRLGSSSTTTSITAAGAPTVHGFNVRPVSTASSSSETSPTNDIRKSDSAVAFDEDVVFAMQDLESALPAAAGGAAAHGHNATMTPSTSSSTVGGLGSSNATSSGQSTPWSHLHTLSALTGGTNGSGHNSPALPASRRPSGPSPWGSSSLAAANVSPKGLPVLCGDHVRHGQCPGGCGKVHGLQCPVCGLHLLHPMAPHEEHHKHIQECLAAPLNGSMFAAEHMTRGQQQQDYDVADQYQQRQAQQPDMWRS